MELNIEANSNCGEEGQFVFMESSAPRSIDWIMVSVKGQDQKFKIVGVHKDGSFGSAFAVSIDDSGEGTAFLIYGGEWGVRYQPESLQDAWDLSNSAQLGDPYKIYASPEDIGFHPF